jgi:hypothetical protein
MMANILLGYSNQIENSTLSGGTWNASFPQSNIKNRLLSKSAMTTTTSLTMTLTATAAQCLGVIETNLPTGSTYSLAAGSFSSGTLTTTLVNQDLLFDLLSPQTGTFTLTINSSSVISIGRIFVGKALKPNVNATRDGFSAGFVSRTRVDESVGGIEYFKNLPIRKNVQVSFDFLTDAEANNAVMSILQNDISSEVLLMNNPNLQMNFLGRLNQLSPVKYPYANLNQAAFDVLEIV